MIITIGTHTVEAALVAYDGYAMLSYRGPTTVFVRGRAYTINQITYVVESILPSAYVKDVLNVKLRNV
jgi:hypothetical protein